MKKLEDVFAEKIFNLVNYALNQLIKPDITIENVRKINEQGIKTLKEKYETEGIILDVDDTLRKDMKMLPKVNQEWLDMMKRNFKVTVVSNGLDGKIEEYLKQKGIDYIFLANKPLKGGFKKACDRMNLKPEKVLVIGDSRLDDIYGGKRNNMYTALVKDVEEEERE